MHLTLFFEAFPAFYIFDNDNVQVELHYKKETRQKKTHKNEIFFSSNLVLMYRNVKV